MIFAGEWKYKPLTLPFGKRFAKWESHAGEFWISRQICCPCAKEAVTIWDKDLPNRAMPVGDVLFEIAIVDLKAAGFETKLTMGFPTLKVFRRRTSAVRSNPLALGLQ